MIFVRNIRKFFDDRKGTIPLEVRTNTLRRARRKSVDGILLANQANRIMRQFPEFFEVVMTNVERAEPEHVRIALEDLNKRTQR